jgi:integrase
MRGYIRRRSKGSWEVTVELGRDPVTQKRLRKTKNVKGARRDAEREQAKLIHQLETGDYVDSGKETTGEFLLRWLRDYAATNVDATTYIRYEQITRLHLIPTLGTVPLGGLRPSHIVSAEQKWLTKGNVRTRGPLSPQTVIHHHRVLREALQQAVKWQVLARNPADAVDPPRAGGDEMSVLGIEQVRTLLLAARGSEIEPVIATAIFTGLRLGEMLGLRWSDIDLVARQLRVVQTIKRLGKGRIVTGSPKTHRSRRTVALPGDLVDLLRDHRLRQLEVRLAAGSAYDGDLVLADAIGRPLNGDRIRARFYALLKTAGLPRIRLHDLRHTHATLMLAQGTHPKIVSERLGHSGIGITLDVYSHVLPGLQAEAAEQLGALIRPPVGGANTAR